MYLSFSKVFIITIDILIVSIFFKLLLGRSLTSIQPLLPVNGLIKNYPITIAIQNKNTSPSIVELFTSEGCLSCPSADKLVAIAQKEFNDNTIVLSYHVDYWDRLGWKDPFSKREFSERQRQYAQHLNLESVYTPQAIVNGKTEFVGSNKSALWTAISSFKDTINKVIEAETVLVNNKKLIVKFDCSELKKNEYLVLELVLKNATTEVMRGENGGTTLNHINIVLDFINIEESKGIATFSLPLNFAKENYIVVAFIQNKESFQITSAKKIDII